MPKTKDSINWNRIKLGSHTDAYYAKKYGVSSVAVHAARTKRGLPPYQATPKEVSKRNAVQHKVNWDKAKLGKKTDAAIARKLGVSTVAVYFQRKKRNIPPFVCSHCGR